MSTILLIDDSWLTRRGLSNILKAWGHEVKEAENGRQGLDMLDTEAPDLILIDLLMPVMDGFEVLAELKNRKVKTPAIVVTADIQDTVKERCLQMGAAGFINKPPNEDELGNVIQDALGA